MIYPDLVAALASRFEPDDQADIYLAQIRSRSRKTSETIPELGQKMKRLARYALLNGPNNVREWLALTYFVEALENEFMEYSVKRARPKSLGQAVHTAVEIEAFQLSRKKRHTNDPKFRMLQEEARAILPASQGSLVSGSIEITGPMDEPRLAAMTATRSTKQPAQPHQRGAPLS